MNNFDKNLNFKKKFVSGELFYTGPFILLLFTVTVMGIFSGVHYFIYKFIYFIIWSLMCVIVSHFYFKIIINIINHTKIKFYLLLTHGLLWCVIIAGISICTSFLLSNGVQFRPYFKINFKILSYIFLIDKNIILLQSIVLMLFHFFGVMYITKYNKGNI